MQLNKFIIPGKVNIIIDGSYGSTGKGLIASRIALENHIDIACSTTSPNAGHTFYYNLKKYITHLIPVAGIIHKRSTIYFSSEAVIDPILLQKEIKEFDIDPNRIYIHPRAPIITEVELQEEQTNNIIKIASTQSGSGAARASKINRKNILAQNHPLTKQYTNSINLKSYLDIDKCHLLVETGQGLGLDINHGPQYPYCTSRSILPGTILGELGLPCRLLGNVLLSFRTYPIRVGNPHKDGNELGYSGDFYPDSKECTFEELGLDPEYTTVTKRKRRIATFSMTQFKYAIDLIEPTYIFLNFMNYYRNNEHHFCKFSNKKYRPTHFGIGPYSHDIYSWTNDNVQRIWK